MIGAGISGLAAAKELREVGVDVTVYEMMPCIGGVFAHYGWEKGRLTSSTSFTWFSDHPIEDREKHLAWKDWLAYLQSYVDKFQTQEAFKFNHKIEDVCRDPEGKWQLKIHENNWSNGHWSHPPADVQAQVPDRTFVETGFDYVLLGSGLHNVPLQPCAVPGQAEFVEKLGGNVTHSSTFRTADHYKGKRVVVVGAGESASDIAWLCSQQADGVAIVVRSNPGTLFPHRINGDTADVRDNRLIYSCPRVPSLKPFLRGQKAFFESTEVANCSENKPDEFAYAAKMNYDAGSCIFSINACKSFGIPKAVLRNGATVHPEICHFEGKDVHFKDGTVFENADSVIFATGYKAQLCHFVSDKDVCANFKDISKLWHNMASPDMDDIFVLGFCRPNQINLITCCEMQARAAAQIISGKKALPSPDERRAKAAAFFDHMEASFMQKRTKALVDFMPFADNLAEFIGCSPNLLSYVTKPQMLHNMIYCPIQPCQYRLRGPGADPKMAEETILKSPIYKGNKWGRILRDGRITIMLFFIFPWLRLVGGAKKFAPVGAIAPICYTVGYSVLAAFVYAFVQLAPSATTVLKMIALVPAMYTFVFFKDVVHKLKGEGESKAAPLGEMMKKDGMMKSKCM